MQGSGSTERNKGPGDVDRGRSKHEPFVTRLGTPVDRNRPGGGLDHHGRAWLRGQGLGCAPCRADVLLTTPDLLPFPRSLGHASSKRPGQRPAVATSPAGKPGFPRDVPACFFTGEASTPRCRRAGRPRGSLVDAWAPVATSAGPRLGSRGVSNRSATPDSGVSCLMTAECYVPGSWCASCSSSGGLGTLGPGLALFTRKLWCAMVWSRLTGVGAW